MVNYSNKEKVFLVAIFRLSCRVSGLSQLFASAGKISWPDLSFPWILHQRWQRGRALVGWLVYRQLTEKDKRRKEKNRYKSVCWDSVKETLNGKWRDAEYNLMSNCTACYVHTRVARFFCSFSPFLWCEYVAFSAALWSKKRRLIAWQLEQNSWYWNRAWERWRGGR